MPVSVVNYSYVRKIWVGGGRGGREREREIERERRGRGEKGQKLLEGDNFREQITYVWFIIQHNIVKGPKGGGDRKEQQLEGAR